MIQKQIAYRYYSDNDLNELSRFLGKYLWTTSYEPPSQWEALFRWKHLNNPFGKSEMAVAVDRSGKIMAFHAGMHWELITGKQVIKCLRWTDPVSDPDLRSQEIGAFTLVALAAKLNEKARLQNISLYFGSGVGKYSLVFTANFGWSEVERLWPFVRVDYHRALSSVIRSKLGRQRGNGYETKDYFRRDPVPVTTLLDHAGIESLLRTDVQLEDSRLLRTCKTLRYLRWRYAEHPTLTHYTLFRERNGELDGAIIFRAGNDLGLKSVVIEEIFLTSPARAVGLLHELHETVAADFIFTRFTSGSRKYDLFRKSGFGTRSRIMRYYYSRGDILLDRLLVYSLDETISVDASLAKNWALSMGDLEWL